MIKATLKIKGIEIHISGGGCLVGQSYTCEHGLFSLDRVSVSVLFGNYTENTLMQYYEGEDSPLFKKKRSHDYYHL